MENKKSKYIFIVLSVACIMMIVISSVKDGIMNPIRNTIGYVLVPFQNGVNTLGFGIYENLKEHRTLEEVLEENKKLNEKIGVLVEQNNRLTQDSGELQRLRELYDLDRDYMQYEKIAARVIAKDSENWFQVFRINKGSQDGIRVDQNVMANGGLIGIVTDVGLNYATVRSIIDDESRVSAMGIQASDTCIVAGDLTLYEKGRLKITDMKKDASIQDGDRIVTSSISAKFMPGILIGYAVDVKEDEKRLMKDGYLIPAADFNDLSEVLVIKEVKSDSFLDENNGEAALNRTKDKTESGDTLPETANVAPGANVKSSWAGMEGLTPLSEVVENHSADTADDYIITAKDISDVPSVTIGSAESEDDDGEGNRENRASRTSAHEDNEGDEGASQSRNPGRQEESEEENRETETTSSPETDRRTEQVSQERNNEEETVRETAAEEDSSEELIEENPG
ncbi:MAG: rod shape-determining protein MreC [Oribacterium sp.]|nr:rod shape-determining protein MreC [Oribacterium sp.]MBO6307478.1 rod shape-determining protein MreC [Oribacterium sp.]MBP3806683.1 rod shape-determining protein MreC [Oribacterium sp.]